MTANPVVCLSYCVQVQRFQQWQSNNRKAKQEAQKLQDLQDALMTQLAVGESDDRVKQYSQMLLEEAASRSLSTKPIALHVTRAAKHRAALTPSM